MRRILLAGDGHGAEAAMNGLLKARIHFDLLTFDEKLKAKALSQNILCVDVLSSWIQSSQDLVISSAFRPMVPKSDLDRCPILNIHYALFPKYRGLHSIVWAMLNGEKEIGVTFHLMNELADAGPIIYQESVAIGSKTSWQLMEYCDSRCEALIAEVVNGFLNGKLKPVAQDESQATYVAKRNKSDCKINWEKWNCDYFERALQALVKPYPRPFFIYKEKEYEIGQAHVERRNYHEVPGHVVYRDTDGVWIKLVDGLIKVKTVWQEGQEISARELFKMPGARLQK